MNNNIIIRNVSQLYKNLNSDLEFKFLTIINQSKDQHYTYKDLYYRINNYLNFFKKNNIKSTSTILIILNESIDTYASFLASMIYGAIPAFYAYPSAKQKKEIFLKSIDDLMKFNDIDLVVTFNDVAQVLINNKNIAKKKIINFSDIDSENEMSEVNLEYENKESFLQFSSGTTGAKKGVKISANSLFNQINNYNLHVKFESKKSRVISWLPHYHDMGLIACMMMPLFTKVEIVSMSPFEWVANPKILLEKIDEYQCTHLWQPNFAFGHLTKSINKNEANKYDLASIEYMVCSSEPVLYKTISNFLNHFSNTNLRKDIIQNCYGMAENTIYMAASTNRKLKFLDINFKELKQNHKIIVEKNGYKLASSGLPLRNNKIKILDNELNEVNESNVGNIYIQSDSLFDGYFNNDELTKNSFYENWFNTGDLGFIYQNEIYVTGRKKELIIIGGENIYPQDVESILNDNEFLIEGRNVAFGIFDDRVGSEKLIVLAEAVENNINKVDKLSIKKEVFNKLNISISDILILPERTLIKSTAGKISRSLNKEAYKNDKFKKELMLELNNLNEDEKQLISIIYEVSTLKDNDNITLQTNLFETGILDSYAFIDFINAIEKKFDLKLPDHLVSFDYFYTIERASSTIKDYKTNNNLIPYHDDSYDIEEVSQPTKKITQTFSEFVLNNFPFKSNLLYQKLMKLFGISVGKNVKILGNISFNLKGKPSNILIKDNVIIGKNTDLRIRENGKIILEKDAYLDSDVRLIAAQNGSIVLGRSTSVGKGTIINSGGNFITGIKCMIGGYCVINSSEHLFKNGRYIADQNFKHGKIVLENDVWIGSNVTVVMNTFIGKGSIIGANSLASGSIPSSGIFSGVPAKFIRKR